MLHNVCRPQPVLPGDKNAINHNFSADSAAPPFLPKNTQNKTDDVFQDTFLNIQSNTQNSSIFLEKGARHSISPDLRNPPPLKTRDVESPLSEQADKLSRLSQIDCPSESDRKEIENLCKNTEIVLKALSKKQKLFVMTRLYNYPDSFIAAMQAAYERNKKCQLLIEDPLLSRSYPHELIPRLAEHSIFHEHLKIIVQKDINKVLLLPETFPEYQTLKAEAEAHKRMMENFKKNYTPWGTRKPSESFCAIQ